MTDDLFLKILCLSISGVIDIDISYSRTMLLIGYILDLDLFIVDLNCSIVAINNLSI